MRFWLRFCAGMIALYALALLLAAVAVFAVIEP